MTKQDFERGYIERSKMTRESYDRIRITLPCHCGEDGCEGWAAIPRSKDSIALHKEDENRRGHN